MTNQIREQSNQQSDRQREKSSHLVSQHQHHRHNIHNDESMPASDALCIYAFTKIAKEWEKIKFISKNTSSYCLTSPNHDSGSLIERQIITAQSS